MAGIPYNLYSFGVLLMAVNNNKRGGCFTMISHGKDIKIFTGNANPALAQEICKIIGTKLGEAEVKSFADGEASEIGRASCRERV